MHPARPPLRQRGKERESKQEKRKGERPWPARPPLRERGKEREVLYSFTSFISFTPFILEKKKKEKKKCGALY